ncbi:hypothetical protein NIES4074_26650 [Cylindrospermum sp. NIES-4074]|nr:hypothetical protein NIES4074_26650 [Cylindrospermum sp. NIES-4074]
MIDNWGLVMNVTMENGWYAANCQYLLGAITSGTLRDGAKRPLEAIAQTLSHLLPKTTTSK